MLWYFQVQLKNSGTLNLAATNITLQVSFEKLLDNDYNSFYVQKVANVTNDYIEITNFTTWPGRLQLIVESSRLAKPFT